MERQQKERQQMEQQQKGNQTAAANRRTESHKVPSQLTSSEAAAVEQVIEKTGAMCEEAAAKSDARAAADDSPPDYLVCPIILEVFVDPVVAADGHTYERAAIENWFRRAHESGAIPTSPKTNMPLSSTCLIPNFTTRQAAEHFVETRPRG